MNNKIITMSVGPVGTNAYIFYNEATHKGVLIDPGCEAEKILNRIKSESLSISAILLTHGHFDHIGAVNDVRQALNIPVYATEKEAVIANDQKLNGTKFFGMAPMTASVDEFLVPDSEINLGCGILRILSTPGHTHGSISIYSAAEKTLFSGDCMFRESYGRHDLPTSNFESLKQSMMMLLKLPEDTEVYPGHGLPTTIGHEKIHNLIINEL